MQIINMKLSEIHPYEKNPRFNDGAVEAVANSIKEFGFQQPIVVDKDLVVVVGHTRLKAAEQLGLTEVPVVIAENLTPEQVQAYRIADNKTGEIVDHFFIFQKNSLHLKMANFSSLKRRSIFTSRKILREKLELHSASKKSLNIAKMVEKRFELPTSTHDLSYEKIRLADCHKTLIFSDKSENPHARVTGVHKFLTLTPPLVLVDNHGADHQEMKPL